MTLYKHTQIGYLMLVVMVIVLAFFIGVYFMALIELPSVNSGPNFAISVVMVMVIFILTSFATLTVVIDENFLRIKFGYGIVRKKFSLKEISSARSVKNHWYYGWGIRWWFWPRYMLIYNVSGFDAVEVTMKNGRIYRIGTDVPEELSVVLRRMIL